MNNLNESHFIVSLSGLKEGAATELEAQFCVSSWEKFSRKIKQEWLPNQHREHPCCTTLYPLSELCYREKKFKTADLQY